MILSIFIIIVSLGLFFYWLRYTCRFLLAADETGDYVRQVAAANQLNVLVAKERLARLRISAPPEVATLEATFQDLERDYRLLLYLTCHLGSAPSATAELFRSMLQVDYTLSRCVYQIAHRIAPGLTPSALHEMSSAVYRMADFMGRQTAVSAKL